ncbi:MAG TPA: 2-dehydro-3-deoxygalactonokinase [Terriglobales bacterium]|nr:2-dehydro-3-deoxygalactonokinase [Terriglobales bacterium]
MGAANTRAWLLEGERVLARAARPVGVRDSARAGSPEALRQGLRELIAELRGSAVDNEPQVVAAAGMITSPQGLCEVPHVPSPAGVEELAAAARWTELKDVTELPALLATGIRSGPPRMAAMRIGTADVMRGEETLCVGLAALGLVKSPGVVLSLGSHWKAIQINAGGQIEGSVTSLAGELLHTAQTHTVLASSLPPERPATLAVPWLDAGMREQRRSGHARVLFGVRLLDLAGQGTPDERYAYAAGAFIASEMDALMSLGVLAKNVPVAIVGSDAIAGGWLHALTAAGVPGGIVSPADSERGFLAGLSRIMLRAIELRSAANPSSPAGGHGDGCSRRPVT